MHIIKPKTARVLRMTAAMRNLKRGDAIVLDKKPKGWNSVQTTAARVGIRVIASAPKGEPAVIARYA